MIGRAAANRCVYDPYRPSALSMDNELTHLRDGGNPVGLHLAGPAGMSFGANPSTNQLQVRLPSPYARRFRRVFGYVGEIQNPPEAMGTVSRALSMLFSDYGSFYVSRCVYEFSPALS